MVDKFFAGMAIGMAAIMACLSLATLYFWWVVVNLAGGFAYAIAAGIFALVAIVFAILAVAFK